MSIKFHETTLKHSRCGRHRSGSDTRPGRTPRVGRRRRTKKRKEERGGNKISSRTRCFVLGYIYIYIIVYSVPLFFFFPLSSSTGELDKAGDQIKLHIMNAWKWDSRETKKRRRTKLVLSDQFRSLGLVSYPSYRVSCVVRSFERVRLIARSIVDTRGVPRVSRF